MNKRRWLKFVLGLWLAVLAALIGTAIYGLRVVAREPTAASGARKCLWAAAAFFLVGAWLTIAGATGTKPLHQHIFSALRRCRPLIRFSLRTFFVSVTIAGCAIGWVGMHLNWIRDRHKAIEWLEEPKHNVLGEWYSNGETMIGRANTRMPLRLRVFGERPIETIHVSRWTGDRAYSLDDLKKLFPEAGKIELVGPANRASFEQELRDLDARIEALRARAMPPQ